MVLQKAVDNLKGRPKDERKAVAGSIAVLIVVILFIGWVILFFNNIRANGQVEPIGIPGRDAFNAPQITEVKLQIQNSFGGVKNSPQIMQDAAAAQNNYSQD